MLSKDIQFAYIGHGAHSLAIQGKVNVLIPNALGKSEQIIVGKWANVNDVAGLKGKTVGTQLGTSGDIVLDIALRKAGITKSDVNVVNMDELVQMTLYYFDKALYNEIIKDWYNQQ